MVVVGAGFGGLRCARDLARVPVRVTLVDRQNHHLFQPLLYQVATAGLNPADIAFPVRSFVRRQKNLDVVLGEVAGFDLGGRRVLLADGAAFPYDELVVAAGATHAYFGHPEWERFAPGLKTIEDALEARRRILIAFEEADRAEDPARRLALLTFVVVGGGPTGVELAGAVAEIARHTLASEFRRIDPRRARVLLVEGLPRVLPAMPEDLSRAAEAQLRALGVEVRTGARVTAIDGESVTLGDERIAARTVLWGAGVAASPLARALGAPLDASGRIRVHPDLTLPGHPEIQVVGDLARLARADGTLVPGVAPAAIQEGRHAARNIARALRGEPKAAFAYFDKGLLATVGRGHAVGAVGPFHLTGTLAWLAWLFVHLLFLVGFRNRLAVFLQWVWSYATFGRGARLIVDTARRWQYARAGERGLEELDRPAARPPGEAPAALPADHHPE